MSSHNSESASSSVRWNSRTDPEFRCRHRDDRVAFVRVVEVGHRLSGRLVTVQYTGQKGGIEAGNQSYSRASRVVFR
jgi:hypothetical protein